MVVESRTFFERLIPKIYVSNFQVIAELMPLIVSVLEELDLAFQECDDAVRALEELRDELAQSKQETKRQKQIRELIEEVRVEFIVEIYSYLVYLP